MTDYFKKYNYAPDIEAVNRSLQLISMGLEDITCTQVLKDCFSMMDLTTLKTNDTPASVSKLVRKVNEFRSHYPEYPNPASICVFSNFAPVLKETLTAEGVHITVVSACFPSSQSFLEVKLKEVEMAVEAGADFIKTSTGKVEVNATPTVAYVMCECIAAFYKVTGRRIGFKPAGGMSTASDAVSYYSIVSTVLGKEWLNKNLFRLGVSRMANNLLSEVEQKTVTYF